jgi:histidinol-phosphatase
VALECADAADAIALASFRRALDVHSKPDRTYVTQVDRAIEQEIRTRITRAFPDHGLVGEEYGEEAGASGQRWYIDPIDGTHNYMRGVPIFGTLLALERDGAMEIGIMSAPAIGRRWFASRGAGAWAVELEPGGWRRESAVRLSASGIERLADAQIVYSSLREIESSGLAPGIRSLIDGVWRDRGFGDFWGYALVAEGAAEAMLEVDIQAWDVAPAIVIVEEAGGRITDLDGEAPVTGASVLASNGRLHDALLGALRGQMPHRA